MRIVRPPKSLYERALDEAARAELQAQKALIDYNIMMGTLEDPSEGEEDESDE